MRNINRGRKTNSDTHVIEKCIIAPDLSVAYSRGDKDGYAHDTEIMLTSGEGKRGVIVGPYESIRKFLGNWVYNPVQTLDLSEANFVLRQKIDGNQEMSPLGYGIGIANQLEKKYDKYDYFKKCMDNGMTLVGIIVDKEGGPGIELFEMKDVVEVCKRHLGLFDNIRWTLKRKRI